MLRDARDEPYGVFIIEVALQGDLEADGESLEDDALSWSASEGAGDSEDGGVRAAAAPARLDTWTVVRRYREFEQLHQALKEMDLPGAPRGGASLLRVRRGFAAQTAAPCLAAVMRRRAARGGVAFRRAAEDISPKRMDERRELERYLRA